MSFSEFYQRSINEPEQFWAEQARRIDWQTPFTQTLDHSNPPFARWFCEGRTNLCHNAIDRWLEKQPEALALIAVSSETEEERTFTFRQLHDEVNAVASMLRSLGVQRGDRVLVYMPMIAEAHITLLACARIGAIHSVVFGGFASHSVAARIDDAKPVLIVSADAGARGGKIIPYKKLLDDAISQAQHQPRHVLLVDRGLAKMARVSGRDVDFASLRHQHIGARVPVAWLESNETSCILYTSGTTGKPKGVQRDVGGYAVALATSMDTIFGGKAGGVFFCASDIGWVVGHSYIVYAPLLAGMATIVYEGLPTWPDCGVWWKIVEKYQVSRMFSAPTAIRVLKKFPTAEIRKHDLSSLEVLYLAGEPLDEPTASWVSNTLDVPVIDNYWQTESGWPIMAIARGLDDRPTRLGSPGVPMYGYNVQLLNEVTGEPCGVNEKGMLVAMVAFFLGNSLMFIFGAAGAAALGMADISDVMIAQGLLLPAIVVLGLNIWTTNDNALYASGLGFANITGMSSKTLSVINGIIGTVCALWLYNNFVGWLTFLSAAIPPVGGVIIADYLMNRRRYEHFATTRMMSVNWVAILAVALGIAAGHWLPGIVPVNAVLGGALSYLILNPILNRKTTAAMTHVEANSVE
ncbi:propionate--CoA ligase [Escherichia coli]|nr:propionate--CoA ligase [Escherichia coli]